MFFLQKPFSQRKTLSWIMETVYKTLQKVMGLFQGQNNTLCGTANLLCTFTYFFEVSENAVRKI